MLLTPLIVLALWINGNLLVFTSRPIQVCIGWADDSVASWKCSPDYTARRLRETEQAVRDAGDGWYQTMGALKLALERIDTLEQDVWAWQQSAEHFENLYNQAKD